MYSDMLHTRLHRLHDAVAPLVHQQTLLRLLGAPEHWEHWEHWDSIGSSRSDQQCHFLVGSSQESHDLSGASSPSRSGWRSWISQTAYNCCFSQSSWSGCVSRSAQECSSGQLVMGGNMLNY